MKRIITFLFLFAFVFAGAQVATDGSVKSNSVVGGITKVPLVNVTTNSVTYSSGDNIGGILTFSPAIRTSSGTAILNSIDIWSTESQTPALTIDIWSSSPTGTFTNNSATTFASGDKAYHLGKITVNSTDYVITGTVARATISGLGIAVKADAGTGIYADIKTGSSPAWTASTNGISIRLSFLSD